MASAHSGSSNILKRKAEVNEGFPFIVLFGEELTDCPGKDKGQFSRVVLSSGEGNYFRKAFFIIFYKNQRTYIPLIDKWEN